MRIETPDQNQEFENVFAGRTIWSFWDGNPPDLVLRCFESIKLNNPTRPVVIVSRSTLHKFLSTQDYPLFDGIRGGPDDFSCAQYLSDWVRLTLLEKYGGVWFDASTICTNSVDSWATTNSDPSKMIMFSMHANPNIHGNWAMAALKPGNPVIRAWLQELSLAYNETGSCKVPTDYIERSFRDFPALEQIWNNPRPPPLPYLWVYLAFQVVLQKNPDLKEHIHLIPSIDGPMYRRYLYNIKHGVTDQAALSQKTADDLATKPLSLSGHDRWFIKLVGNDRKPVQEYLDEKSFAAGSVLDMVSRIHPTPITYGRNLWSFVDVNKAPSPREYSVVRLGEWAERSFPKLHPMPSRLSLLTRSESSLRSIAAVTA